MNNSYFSASIAHRSGPTEQDITRIPIDSTRAGASARHDKPGRYLQLAQPSPFIGDQDNSSNSPEASSR